MIFVGPRGKKMKSSETCDVTIKITDVNEPPIFTENPFNREVYEGKGSNCFENF